ncbi:AMP-binding protein [Vineibacter terrae]|uniref:AMP-binding protein n=1 Tax=Vineibacter terrae TaxID=2586908 RepID=UPI002E338A5D|nr:AMP-binding protein [Vineibacter terrae]HEX2891669.1 AMP-binding protein [Vineibacter terrae]
MSDRGAGVDLSALQQAVGNVIPMGSLPAHHAARDPERAAVTQDDASVSWRALEAAANRRARLFAASGVGEGDFVTIALPNGVEFYETSFAIWKLGATPNVVSSRLPDAELRAIVELVQPRLVVGPDPGRLPGWQVLPAGHTPDPSLSDAALPPKVAPYWKAMSSGGSTGRPKIIVDHNPGVWDPAVGLLGQQPGDVLLNPGPLYHNAPFSLMHAGLFGGGHVVNMDRFDPLRALELIARHRVQWVNFVPTMMHRIGRLPQEQRTAPDLGSLRVVFHMASACPVWLKEQWIGWLGPERIFELYGGTERQGATVISGTEWLAHKGSVGRIQPGARLRVVGEKGKDCAPGEVGEIFFLPDGGRGSTYHYIGADAKSLDDWESIGDMGYVDADDYLYIVDRRTDLIVSGGANIYPAEVEAALDGHPDVSSSVVIGLPDDDLGHRAHALVQLAPGARISADDLRAWLETRLVRYKVPRSFEFVDDFLRDDAGKVRRSALREARMTRPAVV